MEGDARRQELLRLISKKSKTHFEEQSWLKHYM